MAQKLLIYVSGGLIQNIASSQTIDIVIVDKDLQDIGENPVNRYEPDNIIVSGSFHSLFQEDNEFEKEIREELKRLKF